MDIRPFDFLNGFPLHTKVAFERFSIQLDIDLCFILIPAQQNLGYGNNQIYLKDLNRAVQSWPDGLKIIGVYISLEIARK